jgi:UDP-glucose 4-epimerase
MTLRGTRILVTGGAGFIGSHLVDALIKEKPAGLVVVDDMSLGKSANLREARRNFKRLVFYKKDAGDFRAMQRIARTHRIDVVFHLAAIPLASSLVQPKTDVDNALRMATTICDLQRLKHFKTLVLFSSSEAYGTAQYVPIDERHPLAPHTPYAADKAAADLIALSYYTTFGTDTVIVRPFNNYGPRQNEGSYAGVIPITIKRIIEGKAPLIYGDGKQTRDFIYVADTVRAAIAAYREPKTRGNVINVGSGTEISMRALIGRIARHLGSTKRTRMKAPRPGDVRRLCADIRMARKLINFKPRVGFDEGLRNTIDWYERELA